MGFKGVHRPGKAAAAKRASIPPKRVTPGTMPAGVHRASPENVLSLLKAFKSKKK